MPAGRRQRVANGGQTSVPWRLSRSVIDSVGLAGAEFARNAESELLANVAIAHVHAVDHPNLSASPPSTERLLASFEGLR